MYELMAVTKALADENRIRLLAAMEEQELCVCQLVDLIALAPSTVSKHLAILRGARLIEARKDGRWVFYRLASAERVSSSATSALAWVIAEVRKLPRIKDDRRRLQQAQKTGELNRICLESADHGGLAV